MNVAADDNLNDPASGGGYDEEHERNDRGLPPRDQQGLEDGADSDRRTDRDEAADRRRTDVAHARADVGADEGRQPGGELDDQPELTGFDAFEVSVTRSSPLPDPHELRGYDELVPGAAKGMIDAYIRTKQVAADAVERNSMAEAGALTRGSEAESLAMRVFAIGYVALPTLVLTAGTVMAIAGVPSGVIIAIFGALGVFFEQLERIRKRRATGASEA